MHSERPQPSRPPNLGKLRDLVDRLRAPDGCPWDREQTLPDLRAYLLEEAHEAAAAVDRGDWQDLQGELGDLLFQIVFLSALAEAAGAFDLAGVVDGVHAKMVARHPHVFGGEDAVLADAQEVRAAWERRKLEARRQAGADDSPEPRGSMLDGVAPSLPALVGSYRLTQKAAGVGFDWPDVDAVFAKLHEEIAELRTAMAEANGQAEGAAERHPAAVTAIREEVGDLLFTVANLARKLEIDPEGALAGTNLKFRRRFAAIERALGERLGSATLEEMDTLWEGAKSEP